MKPETLERDRNGYLIVKHGSRRFYVTPYESFYAVRDTKGSIQHVSDGRQAFVHSEECAIQLISSGALQ